jgi:hypothetical protein
MDARYKLLLLGDMVEELTCDSKMIQSDFDFVMEQLKHDVNWSDLAKSQTFLPRAVKSVMLRSGDMSMFLRNWDHVATILSTKDIEKISRSNISRGYLYSLLKLVETESESPSFWGKMEERLSKLFGKTSVKEVEGLVREKYAGNVRDLVVKILADSRFSKLGKNALFEYIKHVVGTMTESMVYRTNFKKEWKDLEKEYGMQIKSLLKEMHKYGVNKLFTTSLENREKVWEIVVGLFAEHIIATETLSISKAVLLLKQDAPLEMPSIKSALLGYGDRISDGIKAIKEKSDDLSLEKAIDLVKLCFLTKMDGNVKVEKNAAIKPLFIKWGMPIKKLIGEMEAFAVKNADTLSLVHDHSILQEIFDIWRATIMTTLSESEDYTFSDLKLDMPRLFGGDIKELLRKMREFGTIEDKEIVATFTYYTKSARTVFIGYRSVKPRNAFEKQFDYEINDLLSRMYSFALEKMKNTTFDARLTMWETINATIQSIIREKRPEKETEKSEVPMQTGKSEILDYFEKDLLPKIKTVIENFVQALKSSLEEEPTLEYYQQTSKQYLLAYFVESLHYYINERVSLFYEVKESQHVMKIIMDVLFLFSEDFDKVFLPLFDKMKASNLSPASKKAICDKIVLRLVELVYSSIFKEYE